MAEKKKQRPKPSITPAGIAAHCWLDKPDTKYKDEGEFKVDLILSAEAAAPLVALIDEKMAALKESEEVAELEKKRKEHNKKFAKQPKKQVDELQENIPYLVVTDDNGDETGEVKFKFSSKASGEYKAGPKVGQKWTRKIDVFDAKKKPIKGSVWAGSKLKVAYTVGEYVATVTIGYGVKLYLEAVQVLELVQGGSRTADGYGFGEEEGYESSDDAEQETNDETADESGDESGDEGEEF